MNFFDKLLRSGSKKKQIASFYDRGQVYLKIVIGLKKYLYSSADGFHFKPETKTSSIRLQPPDFSPYLPILVPGPQYIKPSSIVIEGIIPSSEGKILFYHYQKSGDYHVSFIRFNTDGKADYHPQTIWTSPPDWDKFKVNFLGVYQIKDKIISYWYLVNHALLAVVYPNYKISGNISVRQGGYLCKPAQNPLISPNPDNSWESFTTFNPAALYQANRVHILYRAQGHNYVSVIGYASSPDGLQIDFKQKYPCYLPSMPFEKSKHKGRVNPLIVSGGGYQGCEDPRIVKINDRVYMIYTAFNGWDSVRVAITSIALTDFLAHRWLWEKPVLISPPNQIHKNWVIFPEKINGKYAILHSLTPNIMVDYFDNLDFDGNTFIESYWYNGVPSSGLWEYRIRGVGPPPVKTKDGWLVIYHATDKTDPTHYKMGAMILDYNDPTKILYRCHKPILEPNQAYENHGFKPGVVYACGALIIKNTLFVYYGGADSYVCVATAPLDQFLANLKHQKQNYLQPVSLKKL